MLVSSRLMWLVNAKLCAACALGGWQSVAGEIKKQAAAESGGTDLHVDAAAADGI